MADYPFTTLDVFTTRRFGGNPLAVITDAHGLSDDEMQAVAREFNFSETTFVLPPENPAHDARVRIFTPVAELPFAGHPNVGTGHVLAAARGRTELVFEEKAGLVRIEARDGLTRIRAPQPFTRGQALDPALVAASVGLTPDDIDTHAHPPVVGSCGTPFTLARVRPDALGRAVPDLAACRRAGSSMQPGIPGRYAVMIYVPGAPARARMFAPLGGITEDPATGSAAVALAGLLLSVSDGDRSEFVLTQGVEMGRPSELHLRAWHQDGAIITDVAGTCVVVTRGTITV